MTTKKRVSDDRIKDAQVKVHLTIWVLVFALSGLAYGLKFMLGLIAFFVLALLALGVIDGIVAWIVRQRPR